MSHCLCLYLVRSLPGVLSSARIAELSPCSVNNAHTSVSSNILQHISDRIEQYILSQSNFESIVLGLNNDSKVYNLNLFQYSFMLIITELVCSVDFCRWKCFHAALPVPVQVE